MNVRGRFMRATKAAPFLWVFFGILAASGASAQQAPQSVKLGTKTLEVTSTEEARVQAKIDGEILEEDAFIEVEASFDDGTSGAVVLLVSDGGNGCPGNYVVISVDAKGKAAATDPFGTCSDTAETHAKD